MCMQVCGDDTPTLGDVLSCEVCGEFLHRGCLPPSAVAKTSSPRHVLCSECEPLTKLNWNNASTQQIRDFEIMAFDEPSDIGKFSMPKEVKEECRAAVEVANSRVGTQATKFVEYEEATSDCDESNSFATHPPTDESITSYSDESDYELSQGRHPTHSRRRTFSSRRRRRRRRQDEAYELVDSDPQDDSSHSSSGEKQHTDMKTKKSLAAGRGGPGIKQLDVFKGFSEDEIDHKNGEIVKKSEKKTSASSVLNINKAKSKEKLRVKKRNMGTIHMRGKLGKFKSMQRRQILVIDNSEAEKEHAQALGTFSPSSKPIKSSKKDNEPRRKIPRKPGSPPQESNPRPNTLPSPRQRQLNDEREVRKSTSGARKLWRRRRKNRRKRGERKRTLRHPVEDVQSLRRLGAEYGYDVMAVAEVVERSTSDDQIKDLLRKLNAYLIHTNRPPSPDAHNHHYRSRPRPYNSSSPSYGGGLPMGRGMGRSASIRGGRAGARFGGFVGSRGSLRRYRS
ncbi:hypothetical protein AAMO2058_000777900 [Amorphochlora amoebiformis]